MIGTLEAPYEHIRLKVTSQIERTHRLTAVKKELESVAFCEQMMAGDVFVNVGSNVGCYALVAWSRGVRTWAIEPHGPTFQRLLENRDLNHAETMTCYRFAISDSNGTVSLAESSPEPGAACHQIMRFQ